MVMAQLSSIAQRLQRILITTGKQWTFRLTLLVVVDYMQAHQQHVMVFQLSQQAQLLQERCRFMATQNRAVLDALTNELVYVEMTQEELDQLTTDNEAAAANISSKQADKSAILEKLGITAEEAELLLS